MISPEKQLKDLRKQSAPTQEFKKELWRDLDVAWAAEYPSSIGFRWSRIVVVPVAALTLFITMGTGVYAYSSPEVTADSALYPVKRGIESIEARIPRPPGARSEFHARMTERRVAEGEVMLERGRMTPQHLILIAQELDLTVEDLIIAGEDPEVREEIHQRVIERVAVQNERYQHLLQHGTELIDQQYTDQRVELRDQLHETRARIEQADFTPDERQALFPIEINLAESVR